MRTVHGVTPRPPVPHCGGGGLATPNRLGAGPKIPTATATPAVPGRVGMHWKGGRYAPPLQGAQPMPSHCPPDSKCQLQWHL